MPFQVQAGNNGRNVFTSDGSKYKREIAFHPKVSSMTPKSGSVNGGTLVTFKGQHLRPDLNNVCDSSRKRRDLEDFKQTGGDPTVSSIEIQGCEDLPKISEWAKWCPGHQEIFTCS